MSSRHVILLCLKNLPVLINTKLYWQSYCFLYLFESLKQYTAHVWFFKKETNYKCTLLHCKLTENWYDVIKHVLGLRLNFVSCKMSFVSYSNTYFGEYPLSFAACLGLEDMVRYFIVKGACPNKQDTNGNTVLHMMVIHNRMVCK